MRSQERRELFEVPEQLKSESGRLLIVVFDRAVDLLGCCLEEANPHDRSINRRAAAKTSSAGIRSTSPDST